MDKDAIERLGRQRPELLKNAFAEIGFVSAIVLSMMMCEYFVSGFNIVLPAISEALHIPESIRTWPAGVPNLTTAAFLLPCARLSDQYGARVVFLAGHAWLLVWSIVAGFSVSPDMMIACRALQGLGAAAFMPAGIALLGQTYRPGPRKNFVFAIYGACACFGFYFGIIIGGIGGQLLTWGWYFWIGAIFVAIVFILGITTIPRALSLGTPGVTMDWLGTATIVPGLVLVVFALTDGGHAPQGWATPYVYITFVIGALLLIVSVYIEGWVAKQPLIPPELFKPKYMKRLCLALLLAYGVFGLFLFYASFYIETVLQATPLQTAAWFTPLAVGGMILAISGGFVMHLLSGRILLIISGLGFTVSCLLFALIPERTPSGPGGSGSDGELQPSVDFIYWAYIFSAMVTGTIGVDITFNVTNVFITTAVPWKLQATAGAVINSLLYLGIALWLGVAELAVALSNSAYASRQGGGGAEMPLREQYQIGFWIGVALGGLATLLFLSVDIGQAAAELTADEKMAQALEEERQHAELERAHSRAQEEQDGQKR
ncbi:major facilitator superfamily domain-containing protein [Microdochium trichocladiopsis]|uniref:Major facilitator superfamily domain-containing protein n=1 Tax=Microdochium trichocladiopsis TaxID=1682393 RepID=A0A9P8Y001_9PEZI|nr:major facilitator superfamily domain-containing protein [Microdochium trichocladiopsis]KAH7026284.1 major facilitator superfamily domain-containing protein [Microdochium trichocladiopsis]